MAACFLPFLEAAAQETPPPKDLFGDAVRLIKRFEGWHDARHFPYVGYGHRLTAGETFDASISEAFSDSLLRADLKRKCRVFRRYGADSLLLGTLAYNVGESRVLKSRLLQKIVSGDRNIKKEYLSFRKWKGKVVPLLEKRRQAEYELLFINCKNKKAKTKR